MRAAWCVTYENGQTLNSYEPQAYSRIDQNRQYIFELLADSGAIVYGWDVPIEDRLVYVSRNAQPSGGPLQLFVLVGIEKRDSEPLSARVWRFHPHEGRVKIERRDGWASIGEPDFVLWSRPDQGAA